MLTVMFVYLYIVSVCAQCGEQLDSCGRLRLGPPAAGRGGPVHPVAGADDRRGPSDSVHTRRGGLRAEPRVLHRARLPDRSTFFARHSLFPLAGCSSARKWVL